MKRTGTTNKYLKELIGELKKLSIEEKVAIWKRVAVDLEKPTRQRRIVNLSSINRYTKDGEVIVVPGKVLGTGNIDHKITVAAQSFSDSAKKVIEDAKGKAITIKQLVKDNPKGKNVRIIG
jgi:large subunit ribosomal protein L18e